MSRRGRSRERAGGARLGRLLCPAALVLAAYGAIFGGEYSVFEVSRARRDRELELTDLARIQHEIDSLGAWRDSLENDPATLERLARERYGMIRAGEVLYRFAEPDSGLGAAPAGADTLR
jgi:cell division protein FtsB